MVIIGTAIWLAAFGSAVAGPLVAAVMGACRSCLPRTANREERDGALDDAAEDQAIVQVMRRQPRTPFATSSSATTNADNVRGTLILLPLETGWQVNRADSSDSMYPLYNWVSIQRAPEKRPAFGGVVERISVWQGSVGPTRANRSSGSRSGSSVFAQLPASAGTAARAGKHMAVLGTLSVRPPHFFPACRDADVLLPPEQNVRASPSRERSISPRARGGRPPSPRRPSRSPSRSPSPQRSPTAAGAVVKASASSPTATATLCSVSSFDSASRAGANLSLVEDVATKQAAFDTGVVDPSGTPSLTPASATLSSVTTMPAGSMSNNVFFGRSYFGSGVDGVPDKDGEVDVSLLPSPDDRTARAEQHVDGIRHSLAAQEEKNGILAKVEPVLVDAAAGMKKAPIAAGPFAGAGGGDGDQRVQPLADVQSWEIHPIVEGAEPGQLRAMFINNIRQRPEKNLGTASMLVRHAQLALGGSVEGLGRLEEEDVLGEGSFGIVKGARHTYLPGVFAVKRLKKEGTNGDKAEYCTRVEMVVMARLAKIPHPNVLGAVSIDDRAEAIGMPILLPRANGDFAQVLRHGDWPMEAKLSCLEQTACGVRHLHEAGIGHGDIKPANVLLVDDGTGGCVPKVCDFGFARALGERRPKMMGTPGYMPLEVMQNSVLTHEKQDSFAMGVMTFAVCVTPEKYQSNMFISPHLFNAAEVERKKALAAQGDCPLAAAQTQRFEMDVMQRTMEEGSFVELMTVDNLHPDLGSAGARDEVSCYLPAFLDKDPGIRPDMETFERVIGEFIRLVEEA